MKISISNSIKNVTKVSLGTFLGQIILIISLPFITRIYGPEAIGLWAIINACGNILANVGDLGLTNSLMMCDETEVNKSYSFVSLISISVVLLCCPVAFLYCYFQMKNLVFSLICTIIILFYALELVQINMLSTLLNREKKYNALMYNSLVRFSGIAVFSILIGLFGYKTYGYYIANIIGQTFALFFMHFNLKMKLSVVEYRDCIHFIKKNIAFVKYQMPAAISVTIRTELPNLLIGILFGNTVLGYFSVSQKLLTIPVTFLGQSIGKVFYQKAAEMRRMGQSISKFVEKNIDRGMLIALIPMSIFAAIGDAVIVLYFGTQYAIGGVICRIVAFRALFNFISTSIQGIDIVLDKQHYIFITCISQTVMALISVLGGGYFFGNIYAVSILLVVSFIFVQIIFLCKIYDAMGLDPRKMLLKIAVTLSIMIAMAFTIRWMSIYLLKTIDIPFFKHILDCFVM